MAEILMFAANNTHTDPTKNVRDMWKRGMIVTVAEDGHVWGEAEDPAQNAAPRKFALIKFPGIPAARLQKYMATQYDSVMIREIFRRRLWQIQLAEMPAIARNQLASTGVLTVRTSGGDFTWDQIKTFFARLDTNARETADITRETADVTRG